MHSLPKVRLATGYSSESVFQKDSAGVELGSPSIPLETKVLVVGASMAGLGLSIELAVRDVDVLVIDSGERLSSPLSNGLGRMYSGFSSEVLMPQDHDEAVAIFGAGKSAVRWTERVVSEFDVDCGFVPGEPGTLDPVAYASGLRQIALKNGAQISTDTWVVALNPHPSGKGFEVRTSRGRVSAEQVVIATGSDLERLRPHAGVDLVKEDWTYLATSTLPEGLELALPSVAMITGDRKLVVSAQIGGEAGAARDKLAQQMFADFPELMQAGPDGGTIRIANSWQTSMNCSLDGIPRAGTHEGLYYMVAGSDRDLARMAWLGSRTGRWICGEEAPVLSGIERQPVLTRLMAKLSDLVPSS